MLKPLFFVFSVIILTVAACQTESASSSLPTLASLPTSVPSDTPPPPLPTLTSLPTDVLPNLSTTLKPTIASAPTQQVATLLTSPTAVVTPEVIPPDILMTPKVANYSLAVNYTIQDSFPENYPKPPAGNQWVVVVASVKNATEDPITISHNSLVLLDEDNNQYSPEEADQFTTPPLVGATLDPQTSQLGVIRYAIPQDEKPAQLNWCLSQDCTSLLIAQVP